MTRKIFWSEPYRTTLMAHVASVSGDSITLDQTIFYAESGGQESDHGTIGGKQVVLAQKDDQRITYTLEAGHGLAVGDSVETIIDWPRRYRLMRLHFAAEVILELVYRERDVAKVGAHIAADKARIDFAWEGSIAGLFPKLLEQAHKLIREDHPIISAFSDEAAEQRYWEVANFSRVPCGGTHLRRTSEVGTLKLRRKNIGKGKERIEIFINDP